MKTIGISEKTHRELITLKLDEGDKNVEELIEKLIIRYKKAKFSEFSNVFRQRLEEKNIDFGEFLKKSRKIREEIANEWF